MKKILMILCMISIFLGGCSSANSDDDMEVFYLPEEKQEIYIQSIDTLLNENYWKYDRQSISFFGETLADKETGEEIYSASNLMGYNLEKYAGTDAVVATATLLHFNDKKAGTGYFYFIKDELVGVCYTSVDTGKTYSLNDRNVFKRTAEFKGYETDKEPDEFTERSVSFSEYGFSSITSSNGGTKMLAVEEHRVRVYKYTRYMSLMRSISYSEELIPFSATFYDGEKIAVLLGQNVYTEGFEERELTGRISDKIMFYDENYNLIGEYKLESADYSCVAWVDGMLAVFKDTTVEFYNVKDGTLELDSQIFINHRVTAFKYDDLDGDGVYEYIMTDGKDLYVYHETQVAFLSLWQTNIGVDTLYGYIYTGDLNNDGIKEIYICDTTGTIIRYILTEKGFTSSNDDIEYGEKIFAGDFNDDGLDDYIRFTMGETRNTSKIYIAK